MEQQLINAMIKLISKVGGGTLMKDLIQQVDENGNPKVWTASELAHASTFVTAQTENFGTADAIIVIQTLLRKYNLKPDDFQQEAFPDQKNINNDALPETPGVHGLN